MLNLTLIAEYNKKCIVVIINLDIKLKNTIVKRKSWSLKTQNNENIILLNFSHFKFKSIVLFGFFNANATVFK